MHLVLIWSHFIHHTPLVQLITFRPATEVVAGSAQGLQDFKWRIHSTVLLWYWQYCICQFLSWHSFAVICLMGGYHSFSVTMKQQIRINLPCYCAVAWESCCWILKLSVTVSSSAADLKTVEQLVGLRGHPFEICVTVNYSCFHRYNHLLETAQQFQTKLFTASGPYAAAPCRTRTTAQTSHPRVRQCGCEQLAQGCYATANDSGTRTHDPPITSHVRYPLSQRTTLGSQTYFLS